MNPENGQTIKAASAGLDDRQDIIVRVIPVEEGSDEEIEVEIIRSEETTDKELIRDIVHEVVEENFIRGIRIEIMDRGGSDFAIRSRTITALKRALGFNGSENGLKGVGMVERGKIESGDRLRRSRIYVPGNRPRMIQKAPGFGADVVILDLEDSVPPDQKDAARIMVAQALKQVDFGGAERMVRINPLTICGKEDLAVILPSMPDGIVLPKCENAEDIEALERIIETLGHTGMVDGEGTNGRIVILPLIETALGVMNAFSIASSSSRVEALSFGGEDFSRDIGAERTSAGEELLLARSMLVMAAKAAGKQALDTIYSNVKDEAGLRKDTLRMKRLGFDGKGAIHPSQIAVIHEVYTPTDDEIRHAVEVVKAALDSAQSGSGIAMLHGKMIDMPVIRRAEKVIRIARRLGLDVDTE